MLLCVAPTLCVQRCQTRPLVSMFTPQLRQPLTLDTTFASQMRSLTPLIGVSLSRHYAIIDTTIASRAHSWHHFCATDTLMAPLFGAHIFTAMCIYRHQRCAHVDTTTHELWSCWHHNYVKSSLLTSLLRHTHTLASHTHVHAPATLMWFAPSLCACRHQLRVEIARF